ncbi:MAG TPA: CHAD domain-containing protein [Chitinophagaceae bacterium]|nr:CHAD domain-containing protein [Chitinophagaceae bacterium]
MGTADFIFIYWEKEQKEFFKNLAVLKKHSRKKAVHDLRVAVKKLRAALELDFLISEKPLPEDLLKGTEQLFSILGKQRDIEICLVLIDTFKKETGKKYPALKNYFRTLLPIAIKWTKKAVEKYKKKELEEIALLLKNESPVVEQEELKQKIAGIINTHLANCRNYFEKPHKLRQDLKEIYYWIMMIPGSLLPPVEYEKELHDVLDDFGNWQDLSVFEMKIKHFRKDYLPKTFPEYEETKMLQAAVKEKKEELLKVALNKTRSLLRKALKEKPQVD